MPMMVSLITKRKRKKRMKLDYTIKLVSVFVCGLTCSGKFAYSGTENIELASMEKESKIGESIARAAEMVLSRNANVGAYIDGTCKVIAKIPDAATRYRYYRMFMDKACTTQLEKIDGMVPLKRPEFKSAVYSYDRQCEIECRQARSLDCLAKVAEDIWQYLFFVEPTPAPGEELFYPWFKLIEKLKAEEIRRGLKPMSLCEHTINLMERHFLFTYLPYGRGKTDTQNRTAVEARFKQVVGRPIRSAEQYEADARRRVEENLKGQRKQEESNQRPR